MPYSQTGNELVVDLFPSGHPLWQTLVEKPPAGVRYIERKSYRGKAYLLLSSLTRRKNLIHFCNGVKLLFGRRWVADMESVKVFFKSYESMYESDAVAAAQRRLENGECRYILPLTNAARKSLERFLRIKSGVKVIHPTFYSSLNTGAALVRDTVVFVGGSSTDLSFEAKGGMEVSEAWLKLHRSFPNYRMIMCSNPPPDLVKKLSEAGVVVRSAPRNFLLGEIYPRSRVIVLPSMMDTVGYSVLEAMNYGVVPIVSDHFAMPELVGDAGIIIKTPTKLWLDDGSPNLQFRNQLRTGPFEELVDKLADQLTRLLSDDDYWMMLSDKALKRMRSAPFHIDYRNESLKQVYQEALED